MIVLGSDNCTMYLNEQKVNRSLARPIVSVIIPTFNSEQTIERCLSSITNQFYANVETIVVGRSPNEAIVEITEKYKAKFFSLKAERSKARNFGYRNSKGRYLLFLDSDMELTSRVVEECVDLLESNQRIGGVRIPEKSIGSSFWVEVRNFERSFYSETEVESARFFRREQVEKTGGYEEDVVFFEESTLPQKIQQLGYIVTARISAEILHHEENFSFSSWLRKKYYYAKSARKYIKKYPSYAKIQMSLRQRMGLFFSSSRFFKRPNLAVAVLVMKLCEYLAVGMGSMAGSSAQNGSQECQMPTVISLESACQPIDIVG